MGHIERTDEIPNNKFKVTEGVKGAFDLPIEASRYQLGLLYRLEIRIELNSWKKHSSLLKCHSE